MNEKAKGKENEREPEGSFWVGVMFFSSTVKCFNDSRRLFISKSKLVKERVN